MGAHDAYGKEILRRAAGSGDGITSAGRTVRLEDGTTITIDGLVGERLAVEIESRTAKQVRGAILDLWLHGAPKKLLMLVPAHHPAATMEAQARNIMGRMFPRGSFEVVSLSGTGDRRRPELDVPRVRAALARLLGVGSGDRPASPGPGCAPGPAGPGRRPIMASAPFDTIWRRIEAHAGQEFATKRGRPFTYAVERGDRIRPIPESGPTTVTIPRSHVERAVAAWPVEGPSVFSGSLMGPSYVWAILNDPRILGPGGR